MALVAAVIALALIEFIVFGLLVARARVQCQVAAPATTGHPVFERYFRVQQNTLEQLIVFVPSVWLFGYYVSALWAAGLGVLFVDRPGPVPDGLRGGPEEARRGLRPVVPAERDPGGGGAGRGDPEPDVGAPSAATGPWRESATEGRSRLKPLLQLGRVRLALVDDLGVEDLLGLGEGQRQRARRRPAPPRPPEPAGRSSCGSRRGSWRRR